MVILHIRCPPPDHILIALPGSMKRLALCQLKHAILQRNPKHAPIVVAQQVETCNGPRCARARSFRGTRYSVHVEVHVYSWKDNNIIN